jgi:hypothetical protein
MGARRGRVVLPPAMPIKQRGEIVEVMFILVGLVVAGYVLMHQSGATPTGVPALQNAPAPVPVTTSMAGGTGFVAPTPSTPVLVAPAAPVPLLSSASISATQPVHVGTYTLPVSRELRTPAPPPRYLPAGGMRSRL